MQANAIKVSTTNRSSSIRVSERTKKMLEALTMGKESHEQIILRLIKLANNMSTEGTRLVQKNNVLGTRYARLNETIGIETSDQSYTVVCTYNDLTIFSMLRNRQFDNISLKESSYHWEVDLDIVNIKVGNGRWQPPTHAIKDQKRLMLLDLIILKKILENTFDVLIYEIVEENDFLDISKWRMAYERNKLSMDSFRNDVEKILRGKA